MMTTIKKFGNGKYYLCRKSNNARGKNDLWKNKFKGIYRTKQRGCCGIIHFTQHIYVPEELMGKDLYFEVVVNERNS